jgi:molecular chaperone DnaK
LGIDDGIFEVIATSNDTNFGSEDFDQRLTEHFIEILKTKYNKDIKENAVAMQKLMVEVEKAKRKLSVSHQT